MTQPVFVTKYYIWAFGVGSGYNPKSWRLQGSTDGTTWVQIHQVIYYSDWVTYTTQNNNPENLASEKLIWANEFSIAIENQNMYQHFKLIIDANYGHSDRVGFNEFSLFGDLNSPSKLK